MVSMFFLRVISLFSLIALLIALSADALLIAASRVTGGIGIFAKPLGWVTLFSTIWIAALVIGCLTAWKLQLFPFTR